MPSGQSSPLQFVDQPLGVRRDPQHPLTHRATLHRKPADFALAVDDFLVRQHGAQRGTPVHGRLGDERQPHAVRVVSRVSSNRLRLLGRRVVPRLVQQPEDPLRPTKVIWVGRVDLPAPVVVEPQAVELPLEVLDVTRRVHARVLAGLDGVLLGRQAERVPAHRVQHVVAAHPPEARDDVRRGVALGMPDVQAAAARVGEHVEHVELRLGGIEVRVAGVGRAEGLFFSPDRLPFRLDAVVRIGLSLLVHVDKVVGRG